MDELDEFKKKSMKLLIWSEDMFRMLSTGYGLEQIQTETAAWTLWEESIEEMRELWDKYK